MVGKVDSYGILFSILTMLNDTANTVTIGDVDKNKRMSRFRNR